MATCIPEEEREREEKVGLVWRQWRDTVVKHKMMFAAH